MPRPSVVQPAGVTPPLAELPAGVSPREIDRGNLACCASEAGSSERDHGGTTPHTIHVWWARRPHATMQALVAACLDARQHADPGLHPQDAPFHHQRLLDMFGGGGTIACAGATLGVETHSIDSNQLAVFTQKNLLADTPRQPHFLLLELLQHTGQQVLHDLHQRTAPLFPQRADAYGYFWTYSIACAACDYRFYLSKRSWLSKKPHQRIALQVREGTTRQTFHIAEVAGNYQHASVWLGRTGHAVCPACEHHNRSISVQSAREELVAVVGAASPSGKTYHAPGPLSLVSSPELQDLETQLLQRLQIALPTSSLPRWSGVVNPPLYGLERHADLFNPRQRLVFLQLVELLTDQFHSLQTTHGSDLAGTVVGLLSGLLDQLIDWNCRLSMWIPQNEQVGRAFCGPGIAMLWDYIETDPTSTGPANLWAKLERIMTGVRALEPISRPATIRQACAQQLPFADEYFDAIVTDPPYYDNLCYNVLADCFYSWKRLLLRNIDPQLFQADTTDSTHELIASTFRNGTAARAHASYCRQLAKALCEGERVLKPNGVFALVYSHASLRGWDALIQGYRATQLRITSVQPLKVERRHRPRAIASNTVNTCLAFIARRCTQPRQPASLPQLIGQLETLADMLDTTLSRAGWPVGDIAVAVYAQGVALLANASELDDDTTSLIALQTFATCVRQRYPDFRVSSRRSL